VRVVGAHVLVGAPHSLDRERSDLALIGGETEPPDGALRVEVVELAVDDAHPEHQLVGLCGLRPLPGQRLFELRLRPGLEQGLAPDARLPELRALVGGRAEQLGVDARVHLPVLGDPGQRLLVARLGLAVRDLRPRLADRRWHRGTSRGGHREKQWRDPHGRKSLRVKRVDSPYPFWVTASRPPSSRSTRAKAQRTRSPAASTRSIALIVLAPVVTTSSTTATSARAPLGSRPSIHSPVPWPLGSLRTMKGGMGEPAR